MSGGHVTGQVTGGFQPLFDVNKLMFWREALPEKSVLFRGCNEVPLLLGMGGIGVPLLFPAVCVCVCVYPPPPSGLAAADDDDDTSTGTQTCADEV